MDWQSWDYGRMFELPNLHGGFTTMAVLIGVPPGHTQLQGLNMVPGFVGVARCHPSDAYDRQTGRDLAMSRAIRAAAKGFLSFWVNRHRLANPGQSVTNYVGEQLKPRYESLMRRERKDIQRAERRARQARELRQAVRDVTGWPAWMRHESERLPQAQVSTSGLRNARRMAADGVTLGPLLVVEVLDELIARREREDELEQIVHELAHHGPATA